jgi:hypothetical protein
MKANNHIQIRDQLGLTTHIGKVKSYTGVNHNDAAHAGARGVIDGDILPDITFTEADPPTYGLRTWSITRNPKPDDTTTTTKMSDLHTSLRKLTRKLRSTTLKATNTVYNTILQNAKETGADYIIHGYSQAPYRARRDSLEVAWGVHVHRCSRKHGPTLTCTKCHSPLNNTHILGGCRTTSKLRTKRHNNTFLLLHTLLQTTNGRRWPMIGVDLGNTPIKDFTTLKPDITEAMTSQLPQILHPEEESLQNDKPNTSTQPQSIRDYILPPQQRPTHHRPNLTRAIGYTINSNGELIPDPIYRGRRQIQIIECKYSTDGNMQAVIDHIYNIYEPLKHALQIHGTLQAEIIIIPIVISRTGTFNVRTPAGIAQLVSFREEPPDTLTYKQLPKPAKKIAMALHVHAQEWLSYIFKISRKILTTKTKTKPTP